MSVASSHLPQIILQDFLDQAGLAHPHQNHVHFTGAEPIFPSRVRLAEPGAAAIAASALLAARIFEARTGIAQTVRADVTAAAVAMRSWRYLQKIPGSGPLTPKPNTAAFYRTHDERWIFLHQRAAHHLERQRQVLGAPNHSDDLAPHIARWDAEDLELAILEAGACAAVVRTREEWAAHPQGAAVKNMPLFEIQKTGESAPKPAGEGDRPLGGLRVLDLTRILAGPTTTRALAEYGADVLRICSPVYPDDPQMIADTGHGKRSTVLDLRTRADAATLRELIKNCDVFVQGYRPGAIERLGFSPKELQKLRPGIVSVSLSAFGTAGPWQNYRGFDSVVQAASGVVHDETHHLARPYSLPANPLDYTTGYLGAFLTQAALLQRAQDGGSFQVELSLAQTGRYLDQIPRLETSQMQNLPAELPAERLAALTMERQTPRGQLSYLKPAVQLDHTPTYWELPSAPEDHDAPRWTEPQP